MVVSTPLWCCIKVGKSRLAVYFCSFLVPELLEGVLFANIRFHDTVSRGRLLNRFGKDFEGRFLLTSVFTTHANTAIGIDSSLPDNFGRSFINGLSVVTTFITVSVVGGPPFVIAAFIFGSLYYSGEYLAASPWIIAHTRSCV